MVTIILAVLGALTGGLFGAVAGFIAYSVIMGAFGVSDFEGARSMAAALLAAPIGGVAGAILGCLGVLRLRRKTQSAATGAQALIAVGIVAAVLTGLWFYLFWEPPAPTFRAGQPNPVLTYEIRLPAEMIDTGDVSALRTQLRTYKTYAYPDELLGFRMDGDHVILTSHHTMLYRIENRALELWLNQSEKKADYRLLIFDLPYGKDPDPSEEFSDWRPVDHVRSATLSQDIEADGGHDIFIRTRVTR